MKMNTFSHEWFRTKTRFDTEAKGNSDMAFYDTIIFVNLRWLKTVSSTFQDVEFDGSKLPLFIN